MSNIFYGSSNIYRNFDRAVSSGLFSGRNFHLVKCTKKAVFDSHLMSVKSADLVVTSVLENFITEVCTGVPDAEIQLFARQQLTAHVESLFELVTRVPEVSVVICPPMFRSTPNWFGPYLADFQSFLTSEVSRVGSACMGVCAPFLVLPSFLEADGVHLSPAGGDRLLAHIDSQLTLMLVEVSAEKTVAEKTVASNPTSSSVPEASLSRILDVVNQNSSQLSSISSLGLTVSALSRSTTEFETFACRRFKADDLIFARFKEEADADINRSREDRVVITGLASPPASITTHAEKKKYYIDVVTRLVLIACASADPVPKVLDVYINLRKDKGAPLVEARFDTSSGARLFRQEGVRQSKAENSEFVPLFLANCVTQSTRVRIEILKALAKKLTTDTECAFVQGFISRPVLQYHIQDGASSSADGVGRGYYFVDAVAKFGTLLEDNDLSTAYLRAGTTFVGAMSQYFAVLSEQQRAPRAVRTGSNRFPVCRRGGRPSMRRGSSLPRVVTLSESSDRGTKRAADHPPSGEPSKRAESELADISE